MRNRIIFIAIISIFISILFNSIIKPNLGRGTHHILAESTDLSEENIEDLRLHDNIRSSKIISKYGDKMKESRDVVDYNYFNLRKGIEVAVNSEDEILRVIATDDELKTSKGIKIGNNDTDIRSAYGNDSYYRREQGMDIIGYIDKEKSCSIEFWMVDNKVELIRFDESLMK
ncbi:hypothetical protein Curi_c27080 [Gottschalkia acidurici 9a]|uniref:Uncharacterized protein n=1 Tax=Gottschalkia acidurici (strain ATCC 7906 / DSM 604 / BCRC 14475 / CIP 104303 / KCTC 5404 / NCIMB 10678 / 9a) TaxID=1128398 RepID=K0B580_GOTA9|nr:hypothetical protein [Gottschalkia acidurici]AFS79701.1 hypothetical protein Curi_c27080 [Gottschalkia acidurici 9a]